MPEYVLFVVSGYNPDVCFYSVRESLGSRLFFLLLLPIYNRRQFRLVFLHSAFTLPLPSNGCSMDAQWMLKGCSMVAETILSTLSLLSINRLYSARRE
jgi:hypothetical protein